MIKRILAAVFGAVVFGVLVPLGYWLVAETVPLGNLTGVLLLIGIGLLAGAVLGALFPKVFGFVFEAFMDL
jgi:hypothetical protein